eukprot:GHVU01015025.1.p3 GENE.GHVU01015025.1~~GHVU01015025.1.p3  ORF type:complete len:126 (+),score=26.98 GHVU01015025.1:162-539(+)
MSGVGVADKCVEEWQLMKLKKKYSYILFKIDDTQVVVDKCEKGEYADFCKNLPRDDCRYAVCDVPTKSHSKLCFFLWNPDGANVKSKMIYAASKDAISKKLDGIAKSLQATDDDDLKLDNVQKQL